MSHHQARGRAALAAPAAAFGILGLTAAAYPQLLGNGKDMAHGAFLGIGTLSLLLALAALKPLATALCLGSGASGGLFTPTLSTGAVLGGAAGIAWNLAWPGSPAGAYALTGAAAMLGAAMQAPLAGLALVPWGAALVVNALLVGTARVLAHVHSPLDIIAGFVFAAAAAAAAHWVVQRIARRRPLAPSAGQTARGAGRSGRRGSAR